MAKHKESKDKIYETLNYDQFRFLKGNRNIKELKVRKLTQLIKEKDAELPIIVNSKMEILDGQHTFKSLRIVGLPVRYIIKDHLNLQDVRNINSIQGGWTLMDYLLSFCRLGKEEYQLLEWFCRTYKYNIKESMCMLLGKHYADSKTIEPYKKGMFKITHLEQGKTWARRMNEIGEHFEHVRSQKFLYAMLSCFINKSFNYKHWINKLSKNSVKLKIQASRNDYIVNIERLYNYNTSNNKKIRLDLYQTQARN